MPERCEICSCRRCSAEICWADVEAANAHTDELVQRLRALEEAAKDVLRVAYVGDGRIVCPPAFAEPLRRLASAAAKGGER